MDALDLTLLTWPDSARSRSCGPAHTPANATTTATGERLGGYWPGSDRATERTTALGDKISDLPFGRNELVRKYVG